jgi:hypothetical protein
MHTIDGTKGEVKFQKEMGVEIKNKGKGELLNSKESERNLHGTRTFVKTGKPP